MIRLSERLTCISPSETLVMSQKSTDLTSRGIQVINLSLGEPDFATPEHIKEAAKKAIDENFSHYSPVAGFADLRKAICEKLCEENGLHYLPQQIVVSNGAKQSIWNALLSLINEGDEVIIPAPYWVSYPEMVKLSGGNPVYIETTVESDFKISAQQLEQAITPKTKALILCSPSNPTGSVYQKEELAKLVEVLERHPHVFILSDEIYEHIHYSGNHESIAQFQSLSDRTIIINGVSKAYAMTGWRIGWIAAPEKIASACALLQSQQTSGASSISQKAALAAYKGGLSCVEEMRAAFERRRNTVINLLKDISGLNVSNPMGAFYVFPQCNSFFGKSYNGKTIYSSSDLAMYLLEEAHVACVGGDAFGAPDYLRLSYATSDENLLKAMQWIKTALAKLERKE